MKTSLKQGYVHLYTGNGKGKTTAAIGLAVRAAGAGLRVYIAQFAKGRETSELTALENLSELITVRRFGARTFIKDRAHKTDRALAEKGIREAEKNIRGGQYGVVILDELCIACKYNLVPEKTVLDMVRSRPDHVEIVITGRYAPKKLVAAADIVTEMKAVKHYFQKGVKARKGIEW
ncbi:MAG: cob(I)yrinic acid a,c-diamide adenosyltransferase [Chitinispirillaceae bacterium]|nr:cob(I)yrinic acid a,c-diamide adenosyltransferase [Chitinispirillaceae bacterium]